MKKIFKSILLVLLLAILIPQQVFAQKGFTDVGAKAWYYEDVTKLVSKGIIEGYEDGTFRPNSKISIAEFTKILISSLGIKEEPTGQYWASGYLMRADELKILEKSEAISPSVYITRELATKMMVQADYILNGDEPVELGSRKITDPETIKPQYMDSVNKALDKGIITGYSDGTFRGKDGLSRAEASALINRLEVKAPLNESKISAVKIGISEKDVIKILGNPQRKDLSEQGYTWYVYNENLEKYIMVGIKENKVVAIYTTNNEWNVSDIKIGEYLEEEYLDTYMDSMKKVPGLVYTYVFLDTFSEDKVSSILISEKSLVRGDYSNIAQLELAFEEQITDITNVFRLRHGVNPLRTDQILSMSSSLHSQDMAERDFFAHANPEGEGPTDRAKTLGFTRGVGENIACGYDNAIMATEAWYNSKTGHRNNMLSADYARIGVGYSHRLDGNKIYKTYFTQNLSW